MDKKLMAEERHNIRRMQTILLKTPDTNRKREEHVGTVEPKWTVFGWAHAFRPAQLVLMSRLELGHIAIKRLFSYSLNFVSKNIEEYSGLTLHPDVVLRRIG